MVDLPVVFQVSAAPTLGAPVFTLGYRAHGYRRRWWEWGWLWWLARWIVHHWGDPVIPRIP